MRADLILKSNNIFTSTSDKPISGGVAIKGNKILVLHGFLGDWLRVAGNDKYFIIVKKCSSLRYP